MCGWHCKDSNTCIWGTSQRQYRLFPQDNAIQLTVLLLLSSVAKVIDNSVCTNTSENMNDRFQHNSLLFD